MYVFIVFSKTYDKKLNKIMDSYLSNLNLTEKYIK